MRIEQTATPEQVFQWLEEAGFAIWETWGSYERRPIGKDTHRAILCAQKRYPTT